MGKVPHTKCTKVPDKKCHTIYYNVPKKVSHRECQKEETYYVTKYKTDYEKACQQIEVPKCQTKYKEECTYEKKQHCETSYKKECTNEKKQVCETTYTEECKPTYKMFRSVVFSHKYILL